MRVLALVVLLLLLLKHLISFILPLQEYHVIFGQLELTI